MKRATIVFLMLCLIAPICIEAKEKPFGNGLYWELSEDGTLTISGFGAMPNYGFSNSKYFGHKKYEKRPWHKSCQDIRKIVIECGVTTIGDGVFYECKNLKSVEIANSVESIGEWAFYGCGMESIVLPNSVTSIKGAAFGQCENLTTIVIPNSVISIDRVVFSGCKSLKEIQIPNSVTKLGGCAFDGCVSLTSITIPSSISVIEDELFCGCTNLVSVILPNTIKEIQYCAFNGCDNLKKLYIPRSVTKVGEYAFARKASWYEHKLYKTYDGEIMSMPDFMLNDDPTQWGLSPKSVDAYKYGIHDDDGRLLLAGEKGWEVTKLTSSEGNTYFYVVKKNDMKGLVNEKGEWVVPINNNRYTEYLSIYGDFLKVKHNNFYGIISKKGEEIIPISRLYTSINISSNNTFTFTKKGYTGVCDAQGREISTSKLMPTFDEIKASGDYANLEKITEGNKIYYIVKKNNRYGLIDAEGNIIIPVELYSLYQAGQGFLRFQVDYGSYYGIINYQGKITIPTTLGYTWIGNYVSVTKRFTYTMDGYKGECDVNGRPVSKIKIATPKPTDTSSSNSSSSSTTSSRTYSTSNSTSTSSSTTNNGTSTSNNNSGNNTTTVVVEHHRDPVPVQEWQACFACGGMGRMGCDFCGGSGTKYIGDRLHRCSRCNGRGEIPCNTCFGNKGQYITVYR